MDFVPIVLNYTFNTAFHPLSTVCLHKSQLIVYYWKQVLVSGSNGEVVPINIEDIAEVVEIDENGSTHRTFLKESSTDPILGKLSQKAFFYARLYIFSKASSSTIAAS